MALKNESEPRPRIKPATHRRKELKRHKIIQETRDLTHAQKEKNLELVSWTLTLEKPHAYRYCDKKFS